MVDLTIYTAFITAASASIIAVLLPTLYLLYQLLFPRILKFPWPSASTSSKSRREKKDKQTTVIIAGSFNPPHNGHLVMMKYLAMRYQKVIVAIGVNPKKTYAVSPQERADILQKMVGQQSNIHVKVASGYIWRYAMANNAKILFRGIRSWEQDGKDERALHLTNLWGPLVCGPLKWPLPTHYLEGDPKYTSLSSTFVRDRCKEIKENKESTSGKALADLSLFVPQEVVDDIVRAYSK